MVHVAPNREAIRQATPALKGTVEVDETWIGGKRPMELKNTNKTPVVALVQRGGATKDGKVIAFPVERVTAKELKRTIRTHVHPDSLIMTDENRAYHGIGKEFRYGHETVNHSMNEWTRAGASTNTVERFFSLLKRGVVGTFHHVSSQHLSRYVDEFSFRWNHRHVSDTERAASALKGISGKRLTYRNRRGL